MILLSAHYDSYFDGFQDDNTAVAMFLGIARAMIRSGYQPENTLIFVQWRQRNGGCPIQNMTGQRALMKKYLRYIQSGGQRFLPILILNFRQCITALWMGCVALMNMRNLSGSFWMTFRENGPMPQAAERCF